MKWIRTIKGITKIGGGAESVGDGGGPQVGLGGRSHERRGIGTEIRTKFLSSVVCVGVNGGSPGVSGITHPQREKWN